MALAVPLTAAGMRLTPASTGYLGKRMPRPGIRPLNPREADAARAVIESVVGQEIERDMRRILTWGAEGKL